MCRHSRSLGTKSRTKIFKFRGFKTPPTKRSNTTPHYYPKYEISSIEENKLWYYPFKGLPNVTGPEVIVKLYDAGDGSNKQDVSAPKFG